MKSMPDMAEYFKMKKYEYISNLNPGIMVQLLQKIFLQIY